MKRVLITGGLGFLGAALSNRLADDGVDVRILDNVSRGAERRLVKRERFTVRYGDVRSMAQIQEAAVGCDTIFHAAAINGTQAFYERPEEVLDVAIHSILNLRDLCHVANLNDQRPPRIVLFSSSEVYQTPPVYPTPEAVPLSIPDASNPRYSYAAGKIISEMVALHSPAIEEITIIRPHNVYGPDMGFGHVIPELIVKAARAQGGGTLELQGDGEACRSFVFIDDFVSGIMTAVNGGPKRATFNVGTSEEISIMALAEKIRGLVGQHCGIVTGPPAKGGADRRLPDTGALEALGWKPQVSLGDGLQRTVAWHLEHREIWPA